MTTLGKYKVHPVADQLPVIDGEEFDALVADIREHGLQNPVVLAPGGTTIVDGRNRFRACELAGVAPRFETLPVAYTDEQALVAYIVSTNLRRRHLTPGQAAAFGLAIEEHYARLAKERQREAGGGSGRAGGDTRTVPQNSGEPFPRAQEAGRQAARDVGVSHDSISRAKKVRDEAPDLFEKLQTGTATLNDAYKQTKARERAHPEAPEPAPKPTPVMLKLRTHEGVEVPYPLPKGKPTFNPTNEHISWAAWSWNPVTGCLHGCRYCYARELAERESYAASYPVGFTPLFHHERLEAPANTRVPANAETDPRRGRVFVCSMADLYGKWVPREWIEEVHAACIANPQWEYLFLTKFPSRYLDVELPPTAWVGTSVDTQRRVNIAEQSFRRISGVRVKWLSLEPLLEPLVFTDIGAFDWIVIGSQTRTVQPGGEVVAEFAPPFDWVANIVRQAREANVPVYLKPNLLGEVGPQSPGMELPQEQPQLTP